MLTTGGSVKRNLWGQGEPLVTGSQSDDRADQLGGWDMESAPGGQASHGFRVCCPQSLAQRPIPLAKIAKKPYSAASGIDSGSEGSWFDPTRGNCKRRNHLRVAAAFVFCKQLGPFVVRVCQKLRRSGGGAGGARSPQARRPPGRRVTRGFAGASMGATVPSISGTATSVRPAATASRRSSSVRRR
jgi:hypothetical protein